MIVKVLQLQKRASYQFKFIQDKYAYNESQNSFALADGTTQSFNSEKWAEIITKTFVNNPTFDPDNIIELFSTSIDEFKNSNFEFSSKPAMASLERTKIQQGGTATFIGIQFIEKSLLKVISCGDTNLFKISNGEIFCFPFSNVNSLDANSYFINTEKLIQKEIDADHFQCKHFKYHSEDTIILATDALSRLILKNPKVISELLSVNNFEDLHNFCISKWNNKELEEDDISAVIIEINSKNHFKLIQPENTFSFPREEEKPFTPSTIKNDSQNSTNNIHMDELRQNFNGIARDFEEVKKKLQLQKLLIVILIGLLFINTLLIYFTRPQQDEKIQKEITEEKENIRTQLIKTNSSSANKKQKEEAKNLELKDVNEEIDISTLNENGIEN